MPHGGARPNSGPKPKPNKKQPLSAKVTPAVLAYLKSTGKLSVTIDETVQRSKGFRDWKKNRK